MMLRPGFRLLVLTALLVAIGVSADSAAAQSFTINLEVGGTATRFGDYTLGVQQSRVRARPNTARTPVPLYALRDADASERNKTVTVRVLPSGGPSPAGGWGG